MSRGCSEHLSNHCSSSDLAAPSDSALWTSPVRACQFSHASQGQDKRALGRWKEALRAPFIEGPRAALTWRGGQRHPAPDGTRVRDAAYVRQPHQGGAHVRRQPWGTVWAAPSDCFLFSTLPALKRNSSQPRRREASARVALLPRQSFKDAAAAACHRAALYCRAQSAVAARALRPIRRSARWSFCARRLRLFVRCRTSDGTV